MSDNEAPGRSDAEDDDATSWKEVMAGLRAGQAVEIPVGDDQDFKRRQRQLERRAERQGLQVQISRERGLLRAVMIGQAAAPVATTEEGKKDRASREERRAQRRAERAASAGE